MCISLPNVGDFTRAKRPNRLPLVLTQAEVSAVLSRLNSVPALMAELLYGAGLRLLECARLRVKDVDLERRELLVRDGKGRKDRRTLLPEHCVLPLRDHLRRVREQHEADVADGAGWVELPDALGRSSRTRAASGLGIGYSLRRERTERRRAGNGDGTTFTRPRFKLPYMMPSWPPE